jgi:hypothetical protein
MPHILLNDCSTTSSIGLSAGSLLDNKINGTHENPHVGVWKVGCARFESHIAMEWNGHSRNNLVNEQNTLTSAFFVCVLQSK